ncbi:hypothetical protein [Aquisphaera insulae]|uniref:hypothetical protein n=1 Tax=Aquisphaera insulae TaxID=2712864 RepID=UPI0013EE10E1|nr:hypothetical protein [Aquisphaera insulae]
MRPEREDRRAAGAAARRLRGAVVLAGLSAVTLAARSAAGWGQPVKPGEPWIVLREGGGLAPRPHPWVIRVHDDGRVETRAELRRVDPKVIQDLRDLLKKSAFRDLESDDLRRRLEEAGETRKVLEGGHGEVTLEVRDGKAVHSVSLSHPEVYATSRVEPVRRFLSVLDAVRKLERAK